MSRSLRIPGLIDLVRADTRSDIRGLANDSRLDRRFEARGPLINRILVERIRNVLRIDGVPLPSVAPRQDAERVRTQDALRRRLDPSGATPLWDDETIAGLVGVVRGRGGSELGPATQQAAVTKAPLRRSTLRGHNIRTEVTARWRPVRPRMPKRQRR